MVAGHTPTDGYPTATTDLQHDTEDVLNSVLLGAQAVEPEPVLNKNAHIQFLARNLIQGFPLRYTSQDASQPWLMFWTLQAFSILQVGIDPGNKQKAIDTIMTWQHAEGGFGGGPGQAAHLLPTYAAVSALAIVGRAGPNGGWDQIDRKKMYNWFMSLKQSDGSFLVTRNGEVDIRGVYCLLVTAYLLNILTPELVSGTAAFVASCQTYEGGFASASHPYYPASTSDSTSSTCLPSPRPVLGEAHGGYTFCALASWIFLEPFLRSSSSTSPAPSLNLRTLLRWIVYMQGEECELGGFKGRTNKLVDGCYAWWCGGEFALLEALGVSGYAHSQGQVRPEEGNEDDEEGWDDVDDSVFNRRALQEYILIAGQHSAGGLRDKPPKNADAYHTLYCLSGLSAAQHRVFPSMERKQELSDSWTDPALDSALSDSEMSKTAYTEALQWTEEEGTSKIVGPASNRVNATHPLFNLTITHTEAIVSHFYKQTVPKHASQKKHEVRTKAGAASA